MVLSKPYKYMYFKNGNKDDCKINWKLALKKNTTHLEHIPVQFRLKTYLESTTEVCDTPQIYRHTGWVPLHPANLTKPCISTCAVCWGAKQTNPNGALCGRAPCALLSHAGLPWVSFPISHLFAVPSRQLSFRGVFLLLWGRAALFCLRNVWLSYKLRSVKCFSEKVQIYSAPG